MTVIRLVALAFTVCQLPACAGASPGNTAAAAFAFDVRITLSKKAAAKLADLHEGIVVSASYAGNPAPAHQKEADEIGQIDLGEEEVTVPGQAGSAHIPGAKVKRSRIAWIEGPMLLNVNVFSARRSGPDNILACDFFDGPLEHAVKQPIELHCSLINERTETRRRQ